VCSLGILTAFSWTLKSEYSEKSADIIPDRGQGIPAGTRVCDRILIMVQFFKVCSAYQIPILILNNEGTSYVSRSSFVSQYQIGSCHSTWSESVIASEAIAQHIVPADTVPVFFREGPRAVPAKGLRRRKGKGGRVSPWDEAPKCSSGILSSMASKRVIIPANPGDLLCPFSPGLM